MSNRNLKYAHILLIILTASWLNICPQKWENLMCQETKTRIFTFLVMNTFPVVYLELDLVCVCVCTDALKKMSQCCITHTHTHTPRVCLPEAVGNIHTLTLMYAAALKIAEQQSRRERQERNVGEGLPVLSIKNNNIIPRVRGDMCTRHV